MADEVKFTSLCKVGSEWLYRLADLKDGRLYPFFKDPSRTNIFDNRDQLFMREHPLNIGDFGIWDWSAIPNITTIGSDYVISSYNPTIRPYQIIKMTIGTSMASVASKLASGIEVNYQGCDLLFSVKQAGETAEAVLCKREQMEIFDGSIKLKPEITSLPVYQLSLDEVLGTEYGTFYGLIDLGEPTRMVPVKSVDELIKSYFLSNASWSNFKTLGSTRADWKVFKQFLDQYTDESIYQKLIETYGISDEEARNAVLDFANNASQYIQHGNVDPDALKGVIFSVPDIRNQAVEMASALWKQENLKKLTEAEQKLSQIQLQISKTESEIDDEISNKYAEKQKEAEHRISVLENNIGEKTSMIEELDQKIALKSEKLKKIEEDIAASDQLSNEVGRKVSEKLASARGDIASFLADAQIYLQVSGQQSSNLIIEDAVPQTKKNYSFRLGNDLPEEGLELEETADDVIDILSGELAIAGVGKDYVKPLSEYVFSQYLLHHNILLMGPNAQNIADAISAAILGKTADTLTVSSEINRDVVKDIQETAADIVVIRGAFSSKWVDYLPELIADRSRMYIVVHPYYEDLMIEPCSLYNYVYPLPTIAIIDHEQEQEFIGGRISSEFESLAGGRSNPTAMSMIKAARINKYIQTGCSRIIEILSAMDLSEKEVITIAALFIGMPYALMTDRKESFIELVESEMKIDSSIKTDILDLLGKDE